MSHVTESRAKPDQPSGSKLQTPPGVRAHFFSGEMPSSKVQGETPLLDALRLLRDLPTHSSHPVSRGVVQSWAHARPGQHSPQEPLSPS